MITKTDYDAYLETLMLKEEIKEAALDIYAHIVLDAETDYRNGCKAVSVPSRIHKAIHYVNDHANDAVYFEAAKIANSDEQADNYYYAIWRLLEHMERELNEI